MSWADRARKAESTSPTPSPAPKPEGTLPPGAGLRLPSPVPVVVNYHKLPLGHILTLPTEPLGGLLEYLPMGDVAHVARLCKRLNAVAEMDFVWQSQLHGMAHQVQSMGFPFAELPRHFYMGGGKSRTEEENQQRTLTGKEVSETKRKVAAMVQFHNHDSRRTVFLPDLQPVPVTGAAPPTGRFTFRRCDAKVKPEHERFLLTDLTTNLYSGTDEPVRKLMDALVHWSSFDQDRAWGEEEVRSKYGLFDTTQTEEPVVLHQLLVGISPHGPGGRGNPLHFGRSARLVEINFPMASAMLQQFGSPWMRSVFQTFHFDARVTRYFTGPELCSDQYVGLVVIDPLRVLLVRDRGADYQAPGAGLMMYNREDEDHHPVEPRGGRREARPRGREGAQESE